MTLLQYLAYVTRRGGIAALWFGAVVAGVCLCQSTGLLRPPSYRWIVRPLNQIAWKVVQRPVVRAPVAQRLEWWTWPLLVGFVAHVGFGPKHRRPIYRYYGSKFAGAYAGVKQDFNNASRGQLVLGSTGSGKTQIVLNPINETQTIHMRGEEKPGWAGSSARKKFLLLTSQFERQTKALRKRITELRGRIETVQTKEYAPAAEAFANRLYDYLIAFYDANAGVSLAEQAVKSEMAGLLGEEPPPPGLASTLGKAIPEGETISPDLLMSILDETSAAALVAEKPIVLPPGAPDVLKRAGAVWQKAKTKINALEDEIAILQNTVNLRRTELARACDVLKSVRYSQYPWGGAIFDQKGNCYQQLTPMLERHGRADDVVLLQVRPSRAPESWTPAVRVNILSYEDFPPETYAKLIGDTYQSVTEADKLDPFFDPKARKAIADTIRLMRAIRDAQRALPAKPDNSLLVIPALDVIHRLLLDISAKRFDEFLVSVGCALPAEVLKAKPNAQPYLATPAIAAAIDELRVSYYKQPPDQLGGVAGTVDNLLSPFTDPAIAEIICRDNTVQFTDVNKGKVFTVAIPQRFALTRIVINTLISQIIYQITKSRFDDDKQSAAWKIRNVIRQEKDEAQRLAIEADSDVDTIREAQGQTCLAAQMIDALWKKLGGKEKAAPALNNLRNRYACKAASKACAEATAELLNKGFFREISSSKRSGEDANVSESVKEHFLVSPDFLLNLPDFHVIFCPAGSKYLYVHVVPCPIQPDGSIPGWWYGSVNPLAIAAHVVRLPRLRFAGIGGYAAFDFKPSEVVPFWRSAAWRADPRIVRRFALGLDTTWFIIKRLSAARARTMVQYREHLENV